MPYSDTDRLYDDETGPRHEHSVRSLLIILAVFASACAAFGVANLLG